MIFLHGWWSLGLGWHFLDILDGWVWVSGMRELSAWQACSKEIFLFIYLLYSSRPFRGLIFQVFAMVLSLLRRIRAALFHVKTKSTTVSHW
jgi:hypothetical protein